ncbi:MAG: FKBP-type peptidyl-prolyl cis-trans isomerase [Bacteroidota bacterium]
MKNSKFSVCSLLFSILYSLFSIFYFGCSSPNIHNDFSETENGLLYKLVGVGDSERKAKTNDYITAQIIIIADNDSVLFNSREFGIDGTVTFKLPAPMFKKDYREGFQLLSEGDSAIFLTDAYTFFVCINQDIIPEKMNKNSVIRIETKIFKIRNEQEHELDEKEKQRALEMGEFEEKKNLTDYLTLNKITNEPFANGIYYLKIREGNGPVLDSCNVAILYYRGCFLNGKYFDSNYETQPFEYIVGAEDQLIKGLETGVKKMHEGEKAKFIIPSYLAFGSQGSSTGIVPPFTTVIYEVELLKVQ